MVWVLVLVLEGQVVKGALARQLVLLAQDCASQTESYDYNIAKYSRD